jgi:hypothetical protein
VGALRERRSRQPLKLVLELVRNFLRGQTIEDRQGSNSLGLLILTPFLSCGTSIQSLT